MGPGQFLTISLGSAIIPAEMKKSAPWKVQTLRIVLAICLCSRQAFANSQSMERLAKMYLDFEINNATQIKGHACYPQMLKEVLGLDKFLDGNIDGAREIHSEIIQMTEGRLNPNELLRNLFQVRFMLLDRRFKSYSEHQKYLKERLKKLRDSDRTLDRPVTRFVPTDPEVIESLKRSSPEFNEKTPSGSWNLMAARLNTDRFQTLNFLIRELTQEITPEKLESINRLWIRCSVSLHPFLTGATDNPGFADQACIPSKKPGYFDENRDDYSLCSFYTWPTSRILVKDNKSGTVKEILMPPYELIKQGWVKMEASKIPFLPELHWPEPHPAPVEQASTEAAQPIAAPPIEQKLESKEEKPIEAALALEEEAQPQESSSEKETDPLVPPPPPRGIRNHHSLAINKTTTDDSLQAIEILKKLKVKDLAWLSELFGHDKNEFHYRDFQRIWTQLNGKASIRPVGGGGSHKQLLNPAGQVVGSIFSHGDHQSYGRAYIGYLISSFASLGVLKESIESALKELP